jgi:alkylation response protein AidB-like acyl-CoA dehydrogenase
MIDLLPDSEQQQVLDSVQDFLAGEAPIARLRRPWSAGEPRDAALWPSIAQQGWFGLGLPERHGGSGCGPVEEMLLLREAGRHLLSPALLATVLAAHVALACDAPAVLDRILSGQLHVGIALALPDRRWQLLDASEESAVLAWAGEQLTLLPASAFAGRERAEGLDETVQVEFARGGTQTPLAHCGQPLLQARAQLLAAALLVGIAEGARDLSVAYAKVREQFGKPIGSFQAIKHACVDMALRCEAARAQAAFASLALLHRPATAAFEVMAAKLLAAEAAIENGTRAITVHGGMGFTAECDAHHFLKRAHVASHIGGNARQMQAQLAQLARAGPMNA